MPEQKEEHLARQAESVKQSAVHLEHSASAVEQSVDRNTLLAADRTVLAAERTYAAFGADRAPGPLQRRRREGRARRHAARWCGTVTGPALVLFSIFCLVAGVWRELQPGAPPPWPNLRRMPMALPLTANGFLILVACALLAPILTASAWPRDCAAHLPRCDNLPTVGVQLLVSNARPPMFRH
jgi:putative membrane protein